MMRKRLKIAMLCILASVANCSENAVEKAIEAQALADGIALEIKENGSGVSMTAEKDGASVSFGEDVTLPDSFPADVKIYPGLVLTMASTVAEREMFSVLGTTSDAFKKVVDFYVQMAQKNEWNKQTSIEQAAMNMLGYTKEERMLNVVIMNQGEMVSVQITTAKN